MASKRQKRRNKKAAHQKVNAPHAAEMAAWPKPPPMPDGMGGRGELFDPHRTKQDARLAARILSCGVVTEEQAAKVLAGAFRLGAQAVQDGSARDYGAAMRVPAAIAKLEMDRERLELDKEKAGKGEQPELHQHVHSHVHVEAGTPGSVEGVAEQAAIALEKLDRLLLEDGQHGQTIDVAPSNGHAADHPILPTPTNGKANGIPKNGQH